MGTFSEIQDRVERRVIDLPASVVTEVPLLINEAVRRLERRHNFKVMEAETSQMVTTEANHVLAAVPSNYKEARKKPYLVFDNGSTRRLILAASLEAVLSVLTLSDTNDEGEPQVLLDAEPTDDAGARNFEVYPFPNTSSQWNDGNYRVVIPYWKYLADLSADADTNWFTTSAVSYIVLEATSRAFYLNWDETRGALWAERAAVHGRRAVKVDKRSRLGRSTTLTPRYDVHATKYAWRA